MFQQINIPPGTWLYAKVLPVDVTAAEIANWFCECGVPVAEDCVAVRRDEKFGMMCIVSVSREEIRNVLRWCLAQTPRSDSPD
jgi:hypothetical protein